MDPQLEDAATAHIFFFLVMSWTVFCGFKGKISSVLKAWCVGFSGI